MSAESQTRTAATGLSSVPPHAMTVRMLRDWPRGPEHQARLWNDLARTLGPGRARPALKAFETLFGMLDGWIEGPLVLHPDGCPCLSKDEAWWLALITSDPDTRWHVAEERLPRPMRKQAVTLARILDDGLNHLAGPSGLPRRSQILH